MTMNSTYSTYDLGLAAFLVEKGFKLEAMDRDNPRKINFIFKRDDRRGEIEELANDYWSDKELLPPRKYFDTVKMLKNRIYSS